MASSTFKPIKEFPFEFELKKKIFVHPQSQWAPGESLVGDVLEIGPGRGDLILPLASASPNKKFIAIEIGKKRFATLAKNRERKNLSNLLILGGDARLIVPQYGVENTFEKIFVLFPDPWPKDRHRFRRLLTLEFLWILTHLLKPGGHLIMASDVEGYMEQTFKEVSKINSLISALPQGISSERLNDLPETYFEKKWKTMGRRNHFIKMEKTSPTPHLPA